MTTYKVYHDDGNHMTIDAGRAYLAAWLYVDQNQKQIEKLKRAKITVKPPRGKSSLFDVWVEDGSFYMNSW